MSLTFVLGLTSLQSFGFDTSLLGITRGALATFEWGMSVELRSVLSGGRERGEGMMVRFFFSFFLLQMLHQREGGKREDERTLTKQRGVGREERCHSKTESEDRQSSGWCGVVWWFLFDVLEDRASSVGSLSVVCVLVFFCWAFD